MKSATPRLRSVRPQRTAARPKTALADGASDADPSFEVAALDLRPAPSTSTEKRIKAEKEKLKKLEKMQRRERLGAMKAMASSFPMIEERIKSRLPKDIVGRIESAPSKKHIISIQERLCSFRDPCGWRPGRF